MNCSVVLGAIVAFTGVTAIDTSAGAMVRLKVPFTPCDVAVITTCPLFFAVSMPLLVMLAIVESEEVQETELVKSRVVPSPKSPVALICCD